MIVAKVDRHDRLAVPATTRFQGHLEMLLGSSVRRMLVFED